MHPRTVATLDGLREVEWFAKVGVRDTQAAEVLATWKQAVDACSSPQWRDLRIDAANAYRTKLLEASPSEFKRWNAVAAEVRPEARALVAEKSKRVVNVFDLPKEFVSALNWDITHLCLESEFADAAAPGFYAGQAYWYMQGHFPCGWQGPLNTSGRPIIF
jgi:hypothetical protein